MTTSSRRLSVRSGAAKSISRTSTFLATRPPASRHMRAAALSSANPLRPGTPDRAHDARWCPNESIGRPHRHVQGERKRETETSQQSHTIEVSGNLRVMRRGESSERQTGAWQRLAAHLGSVTGRQQHMLPGMPVHTRCCFVLPAASHTPHDGGSNPMVPVSDHMQKQQLPTTECLGRFPSSRQIAWPHRDVWRKPADRDMPAADVFLLHDVNTHHVTKAPPHAVIVGSSKVGN